MHIKLLYKILTIPAILIAFTFHEYAHAWVADKLGDKTPKFQGRLTLNPLAHIDLFGFIMILLAGIGWAKPVEVNTRSFKNFYKDDLKVSIAGPIANIIVAIIAAFIMFIMTKITPTTILSAKIYYIVYTIFNITISINCMLAIFNLIPIPGLDGFSVVRDLFPSTFYKYADVLYKYQMLIFVIFIVTPISTILVLGPANILTAFIKGIFSI